VVLVFVATAVAPLTAFWFAELEPHAMLPPAMQTGALLLTAF